VRTQLRWGEKSFLPKKEDMAKLKTVPPSKSLQETNKEKKKQGKKKDRWKVGVDFSVILLFKPARAMQVTPQKGGGLKSKCACDGRLGENFKGVLQEQRLANNRKGEKCKKDRENVRKKKN